MYMGSGSASASPQSLLSMEPICFTQAVTAWPLWASDYILLLLSSGIDVHPLTLRLRHAAETQTSTADMNSPHWRLSNNSNRTYKTEPWTKRSTPLCCTRGVSLENQENLLPQHSTGWRKPSSPQWLCLSSIRLGTFTYVLFSIQEPRKARPRVATQLEQVVWT